MKWTQKTPTEPGWYWIDCGSGAFIQEVAEVNGELSVMTVECNCYDRDPEPPAPVNDPHWQKVQTRWAGPIPTPQF